MMDSLFTDLKQGCADMGAGGGIPPSKVVMLSLVLFCCFCPCLFDFIRVCLFVSCLIHLLSFFFVFFLVPPFLYCFVEGPLALALASSTFVCLCFHPPPLVHISGTVACLLCYKTIYTHKWFLMPCVRQFDLFFKSGIRQPCKDFRMGLKFNLWHIVLTLGFYIRVDLSFHPSIRLSFCC